MKKDSYYDMLCKKACPSTNMGRGKALKYKLLSESARHLFGQITVPRNGLAPYVGLIKLDEKRCGKVTGRIKMNLSSRSNISYSVILKYPLPKRLFWKKSLITVKSDLMLGIRQILTTGWSL